MIVASRPNRSMTMPATGNSSRSAPVPTATRNPIAEADISRESPMSGMMMVRPCRTAMMSAGPNPPTTSARRCLTRADHRGPIRLGRIADITGSSLPRLAQDGRYQTRHRCCAADGERPRVTDLVGEDSTENGADQQSRTAPTHP